MFLTVAGSKLESTEMPHPRITAVSRPVLTTVMEALPVGLILTHVADLEVIAASDQACRFLGWPSGALAGRRLADVLRKVTLISPGGEVADLSQLPIARACATGEVVRGEPWSIEHADGRRTVALVNAAPIYEQDRILGGLVCWTDVTELKAVERDLRESVAAEAVLLRESNHRIKNHLHAVAALLQMEAQRPGITAGELATAMEDRLLVLAAAHEGFYSARNRGAVNAQWLLESVARALNSRQHPIVISSPSDLEFEDSQVTPVALAINEGISNALKHAFSDGRPGRILVSIERHAGLIVLEIADEGKGLPKQGITDGLGTQILGALARQLNGGYTLTNRTTGGALVRLRFPEMPTKTEKS